MKIFLTCIAALAVAWIQAVFTRRLLGTHAGGSRVLWLAAKLPLWAGFFIALALCGGAGSLVLGGAVAWVAYLVLGIVAVRRMRREEV